MALAMQKEATLKDCPTKNSKKDLTFEGGIGKIKEELECYLTLEHYR